jgi:hypothetical protein
MYDRFIVASADETQRKGWVGVAGFLTTRLAPNARVIPCRDGEQVELVWPQVPPSRDLLIVEAALPASVYATPGEPDRPAGAALVKRLSEAPNPPPCILVAGPDPHLMNAVQRWPNCRLLVLTSPLTMDCLEDIETFATQLAKYCNDRDKGIAPPAPSPPSSNGSPWALLEVNLKGARDSTFTLYKGEGEQPCEPKEDSFTLDVDALERILERSRELRRELSARLADPGQWKTYFPVWKRDYAQLGSQIFDLVNQDRFLYYWGEAKGAGKGNARIRFTLDNRAYDGLWESIYDERDDKWLMLHGGVARRARVRSSERDAVLTPLDGGDGTIHVLAIASDVIPGSRLEGPNDEGWHSLRDRMLHDAQERLERRARTEDLFPQLGNLKSEMDALEDLKSAQNDKAGAPKLDIEILDSAQADPDVPLEELVRRKLTEGPVPAGRSRRYDVVHFAGHALFGEDSGERGYLIFGGGKTTRAVPISLFASWLEDARVQLIYLNCCRSSASRAAFELAGCGVPLAIGFSWDLETAKAVQFAKGFYGQLFRNNLKVCHAFQKARRDLYDEYRDGDPIWTAPVLVAQPARWEKVEACFARG